MASSSSNADKPTPRSLAGELRQYRGGDAAGSVATAAGKIAYWAKGEGRPVALIHGNSAGKEVFARQMSFLAGAGYRAVAFDLPGHGESDDAANPARDYTVPGYASALREAFAQLELAGAVVFGWSLGGHVAIEMAGRGYALKGIVLTGTPPCGPGLEEMASTFLPIPAMEVAAKDNPTRAELANYVAHIYMRLSPVPSVFEALAARSDGRARQIMMAHALAGIDGCHQRTVIRGWEKPIAVLQGAEEPFFANGGLAGLGWRNLWRQKVVEIAGAAHAPFVEQPQAYNALLGAFLKDVFAAG